MASEKHYQGDAAVYAALSKFLFRGYNPAKPLYDEDDSDDFWIKGRGKIYRCQARSSGFKVLKGCKLNGRAKTWRVIEKSASVDGKVQFPESIQSGGVDIVVMCVFFRRQFFIGLFDADDVNSLQSKGHFRKTNRKEKNGRMSHRETLGSRWSINHSGNELKIKMATSRNAEDVTYNFLEKGGKWDELFPSKFEFSDTCWELRNADEEKIGIFTLREGGAIESKGFLISKWRLEDGSKKHKKPKRLVILLSGKLNQQIEFAYRDALDCKLTSFDPQNGSSFSLVRRQESHLSCQSALELPSFTGSFTPPASWKS